VHRLTKAQARRIARLVGKVAAADRKASVLRVTAS
jgi:hypothetical protein